MAGKVEVVLKSAVETTGEGPHWDHKRNSLLFVDILQGDVHKWDSETKKEDTLHIGGNVSFIVPCQKSGYIIGHNTSFTHLDWESSKRTVVAEVDKDVPDTRFNDAKCDAAGRVIGGTMGLETAPTILKPEQGSLYTLGTDHMVQKQADKFTISNGIGWTSDNRTMFFIDSTPKEVYAFDYDLSTGDATNKKTFKKFPDSYGFPDGMAMDTDNKFWIAFFSVGKVIRFDAETGAELQTVNFPVKRTTSCCFGGKNFDELYVTCAKTGMTEEELRNEPLAGSIFCVKELGVKGLPGQEYGGF